MAWSLPLFSHMLHSSERITLVWYPSAVFDKSLNFFSLSPMLTWFKTHSTRVPSAWTLCVATARHTNTSCRLIPIAWRKGHNVCATRASAYWRTLWTPRCRWSPSRHLSRPKSRLRLIILPVAWSSTRNTTRHLILWSQPRPCNSPNLYLYLYVYSYWLFIYHFNYFTCIAYSFKFHSYIHRFELEESC